MKKSIATKIVVLGAIGVMTMAGTSAAFAEDNESNRTTTVTYMSEAAAMDQIAEAESRGTVVDRIDNVEYIKIGNDIYGYSFYHLDEDLVNAWDEYDTKEAAMQAAENSDMMLHDIDVYLTYSFFSDKTVYEYTAHQYYGNLSITCDKHVDVEEIALSFDTERINPGESVELYYSVNEGANVTNVSFTSQDENIATVTMFNNSPIITGINPGTTQITAKATNANGDIISRSIDVHVLTDDVAAEFNV